MRWSIPRTINEDPIPRKFTELVTTFNLVHVLEVVDTLKIINVWIFGF